VDKDGPLGISPLGAHICLGEAVKLAVGAASEYVNLASGVQGTPQLDIRSALRLGDEFTLAIDDILPLPPSVGFGQSRPLFFLRAEERSDELE
jgi:hypothetical protein